MKPAIHLLGYKFCYTLADFKLVSPKGYFVMSVMTSSGCIIWWLVSIIRVRVRVRCSRYMFVVRPCNIVVRPYNIVGRPCHIVVRVRVR